MFMRTVFSGGAMRLLSLSIITAAALGLAEPGRSAFAIEAAASSPFSQALQWRLVGPFRGGRVTAVAGHAEEPNVYYMGAAGGGVWKTEDAGQTWQNVSDGFLQAGTIGAIAVAPSNRDIVYVGTGEAPIRGNTTARGDGVYRSDNAGKTWRRVGPGAAAVDDPQRRTGKRAVEICRRRHPLDEADPGPSIADRQDRDYCFAGRSEPRLGDDRGCGRRRLPLG